MSTRRTAGADAQFSARRDQMQEARRAAAFYNDNLAVCIRTVEFFIRVLRAGLRIVGNVFDIAGATHFKQIVIIRRSAEWISPKQFHTLAAILTQRIIIRWAEAVNSSTEAAGSQARGKGLAAVHKIAFPRAGSAVREISI